MDRSTFDELFEQLKTWGRWEDGRGSLNHIGPAQLAAAAALATDGRSVSMAHDLDTVEGPDNPTPVDHHMTDLVVEGTGATKDYVGAAYHGKAVTHLDAFCHYGFEGRLYDGVTAADVLGEDGASFGDVLAGAPGIVGRGVLLDAARHRQVEWLEPGTAVGPDELSAIADAQGVSVGTGDLVFLRTGHRARRDALGVWDPKNFSAGLDPTSMAWLAERQIAVLGSDGDSDSRPSAVDGLSSPVHILALVAMGVHLVDNMNLEEVAPVCAELSRWEFLCVIAPLRLAGGTGSPVNPIAVF